MPKLKSKSSAKKRFKITANGKILRAHAGKRHGMIKKTSKQIRKKRGMVVMSDADARTVRQHLLPYGR